MTADLTDLFPWTRSTLSKLFDPATAERVIPPMNGVVQRHVLSSGGQPPGVKPPTQAAVLSSVPAGAPAPQSPARSATCSGYLWFGSKNDSKLNDGRDPNTLEAGETVTLNAQNTIRLREPWPSDRYVVIPQIGLVPGGSKVRVTEKPKTGRGSKGEQVFAQVSVPRTFCTTVYVQYTGEKKKLDAAMSKLRELGVQTPAPENTVRAKGLSEVRYFWPEDKVVAEQVSASLAASNSGKKLRIVDLAGAGPKPSPGDHRGLARYVVGLHTSPAICSFAIRGATDLCGSAAPVSRDRLRGISSGTRRQPRDNRLPGRFHASGKKAPRH